VDLVALRGGLRPVAGSVPWVAGLWVAQSLPLFFLGPVAGVAVDRLSRKQVMIAADLARAAIALGFLAIHSPGTTWLAYPLFAGLQGFSTFFEPARTATIPHLTTREELVTANALSAVTWSTLLTSGAMVGGIVAAYLGYQAAFVLNAVSFLASAALISGLRVPPAAARKEAHSGGFGEIRAGFRYVR